MRLSSIAVLLLCSMSVAAEPAPPEVGVELLADQTAVTPGGSVGLAIVFELPEGWHIYWRNRGEGGLEPSFEWTLPPGWNVGPLEFPPPSRHIDATGTHTFIMEADPIILARLSVPADAQAGPPVRVGLNLKWLACKELCVKGGKELSLELPVVAEADEIEPANEGDFEYARDQLPAPPGKAKDLKSLRAVASVDRVEPGAAFQVAVVMEVADGQHINSHRPLGENLKATDAFHDRVEGLEIGRPLFPPGTEETAAGEKVSVYRGSTTVILPVTADRGLSGTQVRLSGVVTYQACSDETGVCMLPTAGEWELTLPVAKPGEIAQPVNAEVFEATRSWIAAAAGVAQGTATRPAGSQADGRGSLARLIARLEGMGYWGYLLMAALGGLILNLMPCVLPVISIKILSFVQQAKENRLRIFTLGLAFAGGIVLSFAVLGGLIVLAGWQWGGLFQTPQFTIIMAALVTAFAMSLFGVFAVFPPRFVNELGEKVQKEGHLNAFGMGLLATFLGTACSAPILSNVIALAVKQPPSKGLLLFLTAGAAMALPYVLLAAQPTWVRLVPRPGKWMGVFEQLVGFALLGTVVFLLNPVATQLGGEGLLRTIVFLLIVSLAVWIYGKVEYEASTTKRVILYGLAAILVIGGWLLAFHYQTNIPKLVARQQAAVLGNLPTAGSWKEGRIPWVPYTRERAEAAVREGKTVFIDYTADWCINCKANERLVLETPEVREAMERLGVVPFKADYTSANPEIRQDLKRHGRAGVPMYVIFPPGRLDRPTVLPELLTQTLVIEALEQAGPSREAEPEWATQPASGPEGRR